MWTYGSELAYCFFISFIMFFMYLMINSEGGIINERGDLLDFSIYGLLAPIFIVMLYHYNAAANVRNWGPIYTTIFVFSFTQIFIDLFLAE